MSTPIDLRVAELLTARLCHDLIGPIGAVNNGLELLAEDALDDRDEAVTLAATSGERARTVLEFHRAALGRAGDELDGRVQQIRELADAFAALQRTTLRADTEGLRDSELRGAARLTLNLVALAADTLPRGGEIALYAATGPPLRVEARASGANAGLGEALRPALDPELGVDALSARTVQAHYTALVAQRVGAALHTEELPGCCRLIAVGPDA